MARSSLDLYCSSSYDAFTLVTMHALPFTGAGLQCRTNLLRLPGNQSVRCFCRDDAEVTLPKLGFVPQTTRSSVVRCSVARLSSHDARLPATPSISDPMYICMRPKTWDGAHALALASCCDFHGAVCCCRFRVWDLRFTLHPNPNFVRDATLLPQQSRYEGSLPPSS